MKRFFTSYFRRRQKAKRSKPAKFGDVYAVEAFLAPFARDEVRACMVKGGDMIIGEKQCPDTLNGLTMGELIDISEKQGDSLDLFREYLEKVLHVTTRDEVILNLPATRVYGFINFVRAELERINNLFASIKSEPTPEEKEAGVDRLNFGMFGLLDCYAQRMGITSHEDASKAPWLNVFACMRIDNEFKAYRQRLQEVMNKRRTQ